MANALTLSEAFSNTKKDIIANAKITLLERAEIGWGWNLSKRTPGAPMALLGIWKYRFLNLNAGWHDPLNSTREGTPSILIGVHVDELSRMLFPKSTEFIRGVVPDPLKPIWNILSLNYGPGYDLDEGEWTHFVAVNLRFGN